MLFLCRLKINHIKEDKGAFIIGTVGTAANSLFLTLSTTSMKKRKVPSACWCTIKRRNLRKTWVCVFSRSGPGEKRESISESCGGSVSLRASELRRMEAVWFRELPWQESVGTWQQEA
jgi:hypothetical protein